MGKVHSLLRCGCACLEEASLMHPHDLLKGRAIFGTARALCTDSHSYCLSANIRVSLTVADKVINVAEGSLLLQDCVCLAHNGRKGDGPPVVKDTSDCITAAGEGRKGGEGNTANSTEECME